MENSKKVKILEMIATDMKNDAANFDGLNFDGETVGKYLGHLGAATAALARIMKLQIEDEGEIK